jgi:chemotaxis protein methyltransferase CheR
VGRVRELVEFSYHNLVKEPYPLALLNNWDVIFCRNVTIYFRLESTKRVIDNFYESLNPGGYLFIGHSETLATISDRFESVERGGVYLYRKPLRRRGDGGRSAREATGSGREARGRDSSVVSTRPSRRPSLAEGVAEPRSAEPAASDTDGAELTAAGYAMLEQGKPDEAHKLASRALELNARDIDALLIRAYADADAGDFVAAIAEANAALAIDPLQASARYVLGIIHQQQGELDEALRQFGRAIYIDPEFVLAHFNTANILRARGEYEEASRSYEMTLRTLYVNPSGSWTLFLGGFRNDLLAKTCERSLIECRRGT